MASRMQFWCFVLVVCALTMAEAQEDILSATEVANANTKFAVRLYDILSKQSGNIFFSPISAHAVLSLAYQGAAGSTAAAFRNALNLPEVTKTATGYHNVMKELNSVPDVTLHIANKVYIAKDFKLKQSFKDVAVNSFLSEAENINFVDKANAANSINSWVEQKTKNRIKDLIQPADLNEETRAVLVNAIYFKGTWKFQFKKHETRKEFFYLNDNDKVECQMMHNTNRYDYTFNSELDAQVLRMPYKNSDVSMVIILPKARNGIAALEEKLKKIDLSTVTNALHNPEVAVSLPKFKIETTVPLNGPLKQMGLGEIFGDTADFSNLIDSKEPLKVSKVIQKAFIEVNEEGAEAAAATAIVGVAILSGAIPQPITMICDHPFIMMIQVQQRSNKYGNVLFFGKLHEPNKG